MANQMAGSATFQELFSEVKRQRDVKRDFKGAASLMLMEPDGNTFSMNTGAVSGIEHFNSLDTFHRQISDRLGIPHKYYERMKSEQPELLAANINTWLHKGDSDGFMVRTLDNNARAFLSTRYRPLDNWDLVSALAPSFEVFKERGLTFKDCGITDRRLYMKATLNDTPMEVTNGDIVYPGVIISNSEIGFGSLSIEPMVWRLVCSNGMITQTSLKKVHVGERGDLDSDSIQELLSDGTKTMRDRAFWMTVRDVLSGTLGSSEWFADEVGKLRAAKEEVIPANKKKTELIEQVQTRYGFSDIETENILESLMHEADYTKYGLANAVTASAQKVEVYDRRVEMERAGHKIIELPKSDWEVLVSTPLN